MAFRDDIADDFSEVMDNVETLTLQMGRPEPETVTINNVNRSGVSRRLSEFWGLELEADDIQFAFGANEFSPSRNAPEIRFNDMLFDSEGIPYIVQSVRSLTMQTRFRVLCKKKNA